MRCKKCNRKLRTFIAIGSYKAYVCPACSGLTAYTPWLMEGVVCGI